MKSVKNRNPLRGVCRGRPSGTDEVGQNTNLKVKKMITMKEIAPILEWVAQNDPTEEQVIEKLREDLGLNQEDAQMVWGVITQKIASLNN